MRALMTMGLAAALAVSVTAQGPAPAVELKVGDTAPDFSLPASDGKTYKLSDFKGKKAVVVAWFPKAFTQGCTIECKSLAENGDKIRMYDVAYFMASTDNVEDNTKFAKATSVTLQGRNGGAVDRRGQEGSRLPAPGRPLQGNGDQVRRADGKRPAGQPLDLLHRQDGQDLPTSRRRSARRPRPRT